MIHLKGLNGLRAIAALAVVVSHTTQSLKEFGLDPFIFGRTFEGSPRGLDLAGFGVSIFFALSGFLITYLLLLENQKDEINIKNFYLRRIFRIWPLYYLYLIICIVVWKLADFNIDTKSLLFYIFFAADIPFILNTILPFIGHYWSLGVEEQFYSFWPLVIKKTGQKLSVFVLGLALILISLKLFFRFFISAGDLSLPYKIIHVIRFQCMMIGAYGAILYYKNNFYFLKIFTSKITQLLSWIILAIILLNRFHIASVLDNEFISIVAVSLIIGQITENNKIINLENTICDFIGKISYGIYVIHPLIIYLFAILLKPIAIGNLYKYIIVYLTIVIMTILLSYISFNYFEKIFLNIKNRFSTIHTSSSFIHK